MESAEEVEARFLRAREARAQQRRADRATGTADTADASQALVEARQQLADLLASSGKSHDSLLAPYINNFASASAGPDGDRSTASVAPSAVIAEAMSFWRTLQEGVQRIINEVKLPAHDVQQANAALAKRLQAIEAARLGRGGTASENAAADAAGAQGASATAEKQQQQEKVRRFRFRRLENYRAAEEEEEATAMSLEELAVRKGASKAASAAAAAAGKTDNAIAAAAAASKRPAGAGEANAIQGLESGCAHLIVAKRAAFVRNVSGCKLFIPPVNGSVFLASVQDCTIYVASRQLRLKDCARCDVYTCCASTPVIEDSNNIRFGGFAAWQAAFSDEAATAATLARLVKALDLPAGGGAQQAAARKRLDGSFKAVDDFTWLRSSPSPHFVIMPEAEWKTVSASDVALPDEDAVEGVTKK